MARRGKIPDPLRRRHLVEQKLDPSRALPIAEAYLEAGRRVEALDFLKQAEAKDRLESLVGEAAEEGDVFLLRAAAAALGEEVDLETWTRTAQRAADAGRALDAAEAERQVARLRG